jgi:hypothetical protein
VGLVSTPLPSIRLGGTGLGAAAPIAAAALVAYGVELVVVGGCALLLAGATDRCGDLDVVPEPGAANLERLCNALDRLGARRPTVRSLDRRELTSVSSPYGRIDLMTQTARREYHHLAIHASQHRVAGVPVPVAAVEDVVRLREHFRGVRDAR